MLTYAAKLTLSPADVSHDDFDEVKRTGGGLTDVEVLDLVQVTSYFNYVNRMVAGLGVQLGVGEGAPGQ